MREKKEMIAVAGAEIPGRQGLTDEITCQVEGGSIPPRRLQKIKETKMKEQKEKESLKIIITNEEADDYCMRTFQMPFEQKLKQVEQAWIDKVKQAIIKEKEAK